MKSKYLILIMGVFLLYGCEIYDYGKGVKKDTERIFSQKKEFIHKLAFQGYVQEKRYCSKCDITKYSLIIKLDTITPKPSFSDIAYAPYYTIRNDTLTICVSEQTFGSAIERAFVKKNANSNNIFFGSKVSNLVSERKSSWLP